MDFLTFLIDAIALASVGYFAVGFILGALNRSSKNAHPEAIAVTAVAIEDDEADIPAPLQVMPNWAGMTAHELRRECEKRSIKWRHFYGRDRHLPKAGMVVALAA